MDAKLKAKWVKALRSGKYKQARNKLVNKRLGYCCIGVCAVIAGIEFDSDTGTTTTARQLGLMDDQIGHLVSMNDTEKRRFKTIADYIEKNI